MIASTALLAPSSTSTIIAYRRAAAPFIPFGRVAPRTLIWSLLLGFGIVAPLTVAVASLDLPTDATLAALAQQRWLGYALHPGALFFKAVLVLPLLEEIFYRGIVLQLARRFCPRWLAVFMSSALFGVTHLGNSAPNAVFAFAIGVVLASLLIHTRSLLATIVCHASINFAWLFLLAPAFGIMEKTLALNPQQPLPSLNPLTEIFPAWWIIVSLGLITAAVAMLMRPVRQKNGRA